MLQKLGRRAAVAAVAAAIISTGAVSATTFTPTAAAAQRSAGPSALAKAPIVILDNVPNGATVRAEIGEVLVVEPGGHLQWSPASSPPTSNVLLRLGSVALPDGSSFTAFLAANRGTAHVQAVGAPVCLNPATPCPQFRELWYATIKVPTPIPQASHPQQPNPTHQPTTALGPARPQPHVQDPGD